VIATRGVKLRPLAYGPDFDWATRLGAVPECNIGNPHGTYTFQNWRSLMVIDLEVL